MRRGTATVIGSLLGALALAGCGAQSPASPAASPAPVATVTTDAPALADPNPAPTLPEPDPAPAPEPAVEATGAASQPPPWLGQRLLPLRPDGYGEIQPTPPELVDRQLTTVDILAPPTGTAFTSSIEPVPPSVAARSTWQAACPVALEGLRYVTVSFWGFDDRPHTGELLVGASVAEDVVEVFRRLHTARFPVEEMRITRPDELDAHPTGDGNNTGSFVCRPSRGTTSWSQHAYGLAVDINPFHNPYAKGDVVLPELASAYLDRSDERPGMILAGDVVTEAFASIGWGWGGSWRSSTDPMHFSASGR